jgi:sensor c-di-GMP phosphodiesterase-like protein
LALFHRYKWIAAIVGVVLTGVPLLWLTSWLQRQGESEAAIIANWSIGTADHLIGQSVSSLNELARRQVNSCDPAHLDLLRQSLFGADAIREIALVDPNGQTLCTNNGRLFAARDTLASAATSEPDIKLDVVQMVDSGERLLRVRLLTPNRTAMLAALLRPKMLLPMVTTEGSHFTGFARMTLADGTLIGTSGNESALHEEHAVSRKQSQSYGSIVTVAMPRAAVLANYEDLRRIGIVVAGLIAVLILFGALIAPWRQQSEHSTSEIERALVAGEFIPYYQPIVDITTGKLLGAEVLVRWKKPDGAIVSPGVFIPLVENSGLIIDLTRSLMRQVCLELGPTMEARPDMYVGFNIAPRHFKDAAVLNDVGAIFEGSPIRLSQVVLELTERYEVENMKATRRVIAALQALGCRIALDDVGTGHAGLSYILKLGVDIIKIDRMFVEAVKTDPQAQAIVATLVDLARNLHMKIIAEGVEQFEQVTYLRDHGIVAAQGFCFSPPVPGPIFVQLVQAIDRRSPPAAKESPAVKSLPRTEAA